MRIQETDKILKEARFSRQDARIHEGGRGLARAWSSLGGVPGIITAAVAIGLAAAGVIAVQRYRQNHSW